MSDLSACHGRTSVGLRDLQVELLYKFAREHRREIETVEDLRALVPTCTPAVFNGAIDALVASGLFTASTGRGRLVIEEPA